MKIKKSVRDQLSNSFIWLDTEEGRIISRSITSLGSFAVGDPTGIVLPLIIESADNMVRKRFVKHFPDLMNRLEKSKQNVNREFLLSDLGQKLIRDTLRQIIEQEDEQKIENQKKFLLNTMIITNPNKEKIATYLKILISLETAQLRILGALSESEKTIAEIMKTKDTSQPTIPLNLKKDFQILIQIDDELFERSMKKLNSENLVTLNINKTGWCDGEYDWQYENEAVYRMKETLDKIISDFGKNFVQYIQDSE